MAVFNNALVALLVLLMVCKLAPEASNSTCHSVISVSLLLLWVLSPVAASYMSMTQNRNLRAEKLCLLLLFMCLMRVSFENMQKILTMIE